MDELQQPVTNLIQNFLGEFGASWDTYIYGDISQLKVEMNNIIEFLLELEFSTLIIKT